MRTPSGRLTATRRFTLRPWQKIAPLALLVLAVFAASAQAHTVTATATCKSVALNWSAFVGSGGGNGGLNTPSGRSSTRPSAVARPRQDGQGILQRHR